MKRKPDIDIAVIALLVLVQLYMGSLRRKEPEEKRQRILEMITTLVHL